MTIDCTHVLRAVCSKACDRNSLIGVFTQHQALASFGHLADGNEQVADRLVVDFEV